MDILVIKIQQTSTQLDLDKLHRVELGWTSLQFRWDFQYAVEDELRVECPRKVIRPDSERQGLYSRRRVLNR